MPDRKEILEVAGRKLPVSNPDKIFFPQTGHTKLDLVRYYLSVADGALGGVAGRPMVLKRFVHGAESDAFFQKRAPSSRPDWIETIVLSFPSGRTAEEVVVRDAAGLAWVVNLAASTSTRTRSGPGTSTTRTNCGSISTRCPAWTGRRSSGSRWSPGTCSAISG